MVRLTTERDVERLRQAALLLEAENRRLTSRVLELTRQLLTAKGEAAEVLQLRLVELERQLSQARDALYGPSSEKRPRPSAAPGPAPAEEKSQRGHGPRQLLPRTFVDGRVSRLVDGHRWRRASARRAA